MALCGPERPRGSYPQNSSLTYNTTCLPLVVLSSGVLLKSDEGIGPDELPEPLSLIPAAVNGGKCTVKIQ